MPRSLEFSPPDSDNRRLANLCGPLDQNLRQIEEAFDVRISRRDSTFSIDGAPAAARNARSALEHFWQMAEQPLSLDDVQLGLVEVRATARKNSNADRPSRARGGVLASSGPSERAATPGARTAVRGRARPVDAASGLPADEAGEAAAGSTSDADPVLHTRRADLHGRTPRQREYLRNILSHDITFGIGPAGTGKTYLAVACAVDALERDAIQRIVLTRPAVEAGERLGFLPGDLAQKVDPYLRPLYDALYDLMGYERTARMFERQAIEIAPLAYMRGRTLNNSFIILDEAQNTTPEQMKMFLTRIGFGSRAVVTGDMTQIDLPRGTASGLIEARRVLQGVRGLAFTEFDSSDVVRHPLVARIVDAYERFAPREE